MWFQVSNSHFSCSALSRIADRTDTFRTKCCRRTPDILVVLLHPGLIRGPLSLALADWQEFRVARRKREMVNKIQMLLGQPVPYHIFGVRFAACAEVLRINDYS